MDSGPLEDHRAHLGEVLEVETNFEAALCFHMARQRIGAVGFSRRNGDALLPAEEHGIKLALDEDGGFGDGDGFGAAVVIEGQAQGLALKIGMDRITQSDVSAEAFRAVFRNGNRISPDCCPVFLIFFHGTIPLSFPYALIIR